MLSRKKAVSEVLGSLIMIAITLVAGAAVFGFVNGQAGISAQAVGASAASNINFLNERETLIYGTMLNSSSAQVWVYNNGAIDPEYMNYLLVTLNQVPSMTCKVSLNPTNLIPPPVSIGLHEAKSFSFSLPPSPQQDCNTGPFQFVKGDAYTLRIVGLYGSSAQMTVQF